MWDIILTIHKNIQRFAATYIRTLSDIPLIDEYHDIINKTILERYGLEYPDPFKTAELAIRDINVCEAMMIITECALNAMHSSDLQITSNMTKRDYELISLIEKIIEYCDHVFRDSAFVSRLYYSFQQSSYKNLDTSSYNSIAYQMFNEMGVDKALQITIQTLQQMIDEAIATSNDVKLFSKLRIRLH